MRTPCLSIPQAPSLCSGAHPCAKTCSAEPTLPHAFCCAQVTPPGGWMSVHVPEAVQLPQVALQKPPACSQASEHCGQGQRRGGVCLLKPHCSARLEALLLPAQSVASAFPRLRASALVHPLCQAPLRRFYLAPCLLLCAGEAAGRGHVGAGSRGRALLRWRRAAAPACGCTPALRQHPVSTALAPALLLGAGGAICQLTGSTLSLICRTAL